MSKSRDPQNQMLVLKAPKGGAGGHGGLKGGLKGPPVGGCSLGGYGPTGYAKGGKDAGGDTTGDGFEGSVVMLYKIIWYMEYHIYIIHT